MEDIFKIKISQEFLQSAIVNVDVSGTTEPTWTGMTYLLSGGTNNSSVLTGLTIPIMFKQTYKDIGYYTGFDGAIYQKDINNSFMYSATTGSPYVLYVYNTSEQVSQDITYTIDWGDGTPYESVNVKSPEYISHNYYFGPTTESNKTYSVSMSGSAAWGVTVTTKKIVIPYSGLTTPNEEGEHYFIPMGTYWSGTPISYKWIFTGDSQNNFQSQISSKFVTIPFLITGFTNSKLTELKLYGPNPYIEGVPIIKKGEIVGVVDNLGPNYTGYTYNNVKYFDFPSNSNNPQGYTLFVQNSSGLTENNISLIPIVKEEILIGMVNGLEVQSNVFIDRGKLSGTESLLRLGEIDSIEDLTQYGYGYFIIKDN